MKSNPTSSFQVENGSRILIVGGEPPSVHRTDFPTGDEELVEWARQKFGGVTSFTKVRNLLNASTTGADGEWHRGQRCRLKKPPENQKPLQRTVFHNFTFTIAAVWRKMSCDGVILLVYLSRDNAR